MSQTFEEIAGPKLDALYSGALFLCAGDGGAAEALLVETLTTAADLYPSACAESAPVPWLEKRLVRTFLGGGTKARASRTRASGDRELVPLLVAASSVGPRPRAALWLVLLRRWSYDAAQEALGLDRDRLLGLLDRQTTFHRAFRAAGTSKTRSGRDVSGGPPLGGRGGGPL